LRVRPGGAEVLVAEDRDGLLVLDEGRGHLLQKATPRVEDLAAGILRVLAVLADAQHAVHRQLLAAQGQGGLDGRADGEAVLLRQVAAHLLLGELIDVQGRQLDARERLAVKGVALQELGEEDVGVRPAVVYGDDSGYFLRRVHASSVRPARASVKGITQLEKLEPHAGRWCPFLYKRSRCTRAHLAGHQREGRGDGETQPGNGGRGREAGTA